MKIKINEEWSIEDNGSGYTLTKWSGKINEKTNTQINDVQKYPPSLIEAIKLYARLSAIEQTEQMTLKQYVDEINQAINRVEKMLKGGNHDG